MAHIPDGVLSVPVLVGGGVVTAAALAYALKKLDEDRLPRVAVLAALFFVASLISVAVGPTSVHLLLSGLMGLIIGWSAVPAVFVGLVLQAVFFGFGGVTTLGVNTMNIALPGVLWAMLFAPLLANANPRRAAMVGATVAALSVASTAVMVALSLTLSDASYTLSARIVLLSYGPLLVGEAILTGFACAFLARVSPDIFLAPAMRRGGKLAAS
ncbi:cobalt transporter CbiM [Kaistia terrae]|uniref:Cobalt transporter CbiM n=1 Tax=Kaistia terrae TaxID=537017 RepID=A0ABW0PRE2_9HYPH|nr:cobalt transporter CbiM [Kaistia terrae]MCX5577854.1 cobalt transporter CbiM [Kaistia terrae]